MQREVSAVDSEFAGVAQDDHCRLAQLMCHTARPLFAAAARAWLLGGILSVLAALPPAAAPMLAHQPYAPLNPSKTIRPPPL